MLSPGFKTPPFLGGSFDSFEDSTFFSSGSSVIFPSASRNPAKSGAALSFFLNAAIAGLISRAGTGAFAINSSRDNR